MLHKYQYHLPADFAPESRVWIYQSSRLFFNNEAIQIEEMMNEFVAGWLSHGAKVKGFAKLFFGTFIVIIADEAATGVSGCSTDSSVRMIKEMEKKFNVDLFDRQLLAFYINNNIWHLPMSQLENTIKNKLVTKESLYFNNTIQTKKQLEEEWIIPVKDCWLYKRFSFEGE